MFLKLTRRTWPDSIRARIFALGRLGTPKRKIAELTGASTPTVFNWCGGMPRRHGPERAFCSAIDTVSIPGMFYRDLEHFVLIQADIDTAQWYSSPRMNPQAELLKLIKAEWTRILARNPRVSLRAFARRLGVQPSFLSELLAGKRTLTRNSTAKLLEGLGADPATRKKLLAPFGQRNRVKGVQSGEYLVLSQDQFHILADWFYFAVHALADTHDFHEDAGWIAKRLSIRVRDARSALERLERCGFLVRDEEGTLRPGSASITTTTDIADLSLRKNHRQNLELAELSLETDDLMRRDFSAITFSTSSAKIAEAKKMILEFRRSLCAHLENVPQSEKNEVLQLNVQLFPLTGRNPKGMSS